MKTTKLHILFLLISLNTLIAQINPKNIEIIRDQYGVPHIFGKTDAEVAYGLAWAHSEDDFKTIQQAYLAGNGLLSKHLGSNGAGADFLSQLIRSDYVIDSLVLKQVAGILTPQDVIDLNEWLQEVES